MEYLEIQQFALDLLKFADGYARESGYIFDSQCLNNLGVAIIDGMQRKYSQDERSYGQRIYSAQPNVARVVSDMYPYAQENVLYVSSLEISLKRIHDFFCPGFFPFC